MSERMKALPFVVYELFSKNCKRCSLETLPISVPSFQYFVQGEGDGQETHKVFLAVNRIKRYFWTNFSKESYSAPFLLALTKERISVL